MVCSVYVGQLFKQPGNEMKVSSPEVMDAGLNAAGGFQRRQHVFGLCVNSEAASCHLASQMDVTVSSAQP